MNVTLAKALKEKSRLAGKLKRNFAIIAKENSRVSGTERRFDLKELMDATMDLHRKLIEVKQAIARANAPIAPKLAEMEELKSAIAYLNTIDTTDGVQPSSYRDSPVTYQVIFSKLDLMNRTDDLQKRADELQDELDEFNGSTKLQIPD